DKFCPLPYAFAIPGNDLRPVIVRIERPRLDDPVPEVRQNVPGDRRERRFVRVEPQILARTLLDQGRHSLGDITELSERVSYRKGFGKEEDFHWHSPLSDLRALSGPATRFNSARRFA